MLLCVHMTRVLFLVLVGNFALTMASIGATCSYSSRPFLCALGLLLSIQCSYNSQGQMPYRQYRSTMLYMGRICSTVVTSERGRVGKSLPFFDLSECVQMSVCPQNHTEDLLLHLCQMSIHMCDALGIIRECIYSVLKSYYPASGWWELSPTAPIVYAALPYSLMVHHNSRCESVS